jgi:hypothetical protein
MMSYVITIKILVSTLNTFPVFIRRREILTLILRAFLLYGCLCTHHRTDGQCDVIPVLNEAPRYKDMFGGGATAPCILYLGTSRN